MMKGDIYAILIDCKALLGKINLVYLNYLHTNATLVLQLFVAIRRVLRKHLLYYTLHRGHFGESSIGGSENKMSSLTINIQRTHACRAALARHLSGYRGSDELDRIPLTRYLFTFVTSSHYTLVHIFSYCYMS